MTPRELVDRHPRVFHVAAAESWPSIRRHGLLSVERLVALHGLTGEPRDALLRRQRLVSTRLGHGAAGDVGVAVVRDQLPLKFAHRRLEPGTDLPTFLEALNSRVFFHPTRERLERLLGARAYRGVTQVVLSLDTAGLVERYGAVVGLCRFNSGACTQLNHPVRGPGSWLSIADYPYDEYRLRYAAALAEVTVPDAVPDVLDLTTDVEWVTPTGPAPGRRSCQPR